MFNYQTIFNQLGGTGRLKAMVGGANFGFNDKEKSISFRFKGSRKVNHCKVYYDGASDTYNVEFGKLAKFDYNIKKEFEGVYADQLVSVFESATGLYLKL